MGNKIAAIAKKYMTVLILIVVVIFFALSDEKFLTLDNMLSILRQVSIVGVCSVGLACCMLLGDVNLSIGVVQGLVGVICTLLLKNLGIPVILAYVISVILGTVIGYLLGTIIVHTGMPALIGSLGARYIINGAAYLIAGGLPIYGLPDEAKWIGQGSIGIIPVPVIILLIFFVIGTILLNKTNIGRYLFAIGSNAEATRLSGINVTKVRIFAFTFSMFCASVAGLIFMARNASGQPNGGAGMEMSAMTACVVGGVSAMGGECNPLNLAVGVVIIGVLTNGLTILGVSEYWQTIIRGIVLIVAVGFDFYQKTHKAKAKVS